MSSEYNGVEMYRISDDPRERAKMIKDLSTGVHAAKNIKGELCIVSVVQGESMMVKVQRGLRTEITQYNSKGVAVAFNN